MKLYENVERIKKDVSTMTNHASLAGYLLALLNHIDTDTSSDRVEFDISKDINPNDLLHAFYAMLKMNGREPKILALEAPYFVPNGGVDMNTFVESGSFKWGVEMVVTYPENDTEPMETVAERRLGLMYDTMENAKATTHEGLLWAWISRVPFE